MGLRCLPCGSFATVSFISFFFCVHWSRLRCFVSCFLPSGCVCSLVPCFAFLSVLSPSLCSVLSRSSCSLALSFILTVLFLLCFLDFVSHFLFMCIFLVIVSSAFSCLCLFSVLSVVSGVSVLRLLAFPWGLFPAFRVPLLFFCISFMFWVVFPSVLFWYSRLLLLLSLDLLGFTSVVGFAFFLQFRLWLHLFFTLLYSLSTCCGSGCSLQSSSAFFRRLWLRLIVSVLPPRFSSSCGFGCTFLFLFPFSVFCDFPVLSGLYPGFSASCASGCSSLLARLLLSSMLQVLHWRFLGCPGVVFPAFKLVFFRKVFTACFVFLCLSLRLHFLPWCLLFHVLVVMFFAPASVLPPPVLPSSVWCGIMVFCFLTRLNLRFTSRRTVFDGL